jgi:tetratricopeptide (TPR) repeat protein
MKESDLCNPDEASNIPSKTLEIIRAKASLASSQARLAYIEEENPGKAREIYGVALELFRSLGDDLMVAETLYALSEVLQEHDQDLEAIMRLEEALDLYHIVDEETRIGDTLVRLGTLQRARSPDAALIILYEALEIYRGLGNDLEAAMVLKHLGSVKGDLSEFDEAKKYLEKPRKRYADPKRPSAGCSLSQDTDESRAGLPRYGAAREGQGSLLRRAQAVEGAAEDQKSR